MKCGPGDRLAALTIMTNSPYVSTANQMRDFAMAGNRAMRRAAAKADRKKGRPRVNHSRRRLIDVIEYAREGAQLVRPSEVARMTAGLRAGIEHMRIGKGSYKDWQHITSWTNILYAVNDQGVISKMLPAIAAVEEACRSIYQRATGGDARTDERPARWETPTLRAEELDGIRLAMDLAMLVFRVLSVREYEEAYALALARVKTERGVVEVAEVPAPADDHFRGVGKKVC